MKTDLFLPLYAGIMVFLLIAVMLIVDQSTPTIFIFILLLAYSSFITLFFWRRDGQLIKTRLPTLKDFQDSQVRPPKLANFQRISESILRDIRSDRASSNFQPAFRPSYPSQYANVKSLDQLSLSRQDIDRNYQIFSNYNSVVWKELFREALHHLSDNLASAQDFSNNSGVYRSVLAKYCFNLQKLNEAENIGRDFLMDRAKRYFNKIQLLIDEANTLLTKNFGITLTKVEVARQNQIGLEVFSNVLKNYFQSFLLPKNMTPRQSEANIQKDMVRLRAITNQMSPLIAYPQGSFAPLLLLEIIKLQFSTLKVELNRNQARNGHCLKMSMDFEMSWDHAPEFRSLNCNKILLVLLVLLAKQNRQENRILQTFRAFQS